MLYLDSSALVKLVLPEPESEALIRRLRPSAAEASSMVAAVEVPRAVARVSSDSRARARVDEVLEAIDLREVDEEIVAEARTIDPAVRSLDAIHLATALTLAESLEGLITYDRRLAAAAAGAGIDVLAPG